MQPWKILQFTDKLPWDACTHNKSMFMIAADHIMLIFSKHIVFG
jgi:hypothetical protein